MVKFNFSFDASVSVEQRIGFELAGMIWSSFLKDDVSVNLHIGSKKTLENEKAVGGAVPLFHDQTYGVFKEYLAQDATAIAEGSSPDATAIAALQQGNTVDLLRDQEVVDGNTDILLTSAQAKALGMDLAITLENGAVWDRDLVDPNALDGFIVISGHYDWDYNYTRIGEATENKLDFLSMALHEIGHNLGFVSGIDGTMDVLKMFSGETRIQDFTVLDLFRQSSESQAIENADGSISSVSVGGDTYFSIDGGATNLGNLSTGKESRGDGYQASHWKRMQQAMGIMDPTLAYREQLSLSKRDLQAMDVLGWDVDYSSLDTELDIEALLTQAEQIISSNLGLSNNFLTENRTDSHYYALGYGELFQVLEQQMLALGYGELFQIFELGYGELFQELETSTTADYSQLWQRLEAYLFELGYGELFQEFQEEMLELGYGELFQMFELGYGELFQELDKHRDTLEQAKGSSGIEIDRSESQKSVSILGSNADDILAGGQSQDLVSGGGGDDIIDGKNGNDRLLGEDGNDILYGLAGKDSLYGGDGDDLLMGEAGDDLLVGEEGNDILSAGHGNDLLKGGSGQDVLIGQQGDDALDGGEDRDDVRGGEGNDIVIGGLGKDLVSGGKGNDSLFGDLYTSFVSPQSNDTVNNNPVNSLERIAAQAGIIKASSLLPVDFWIRLEAEDFKLDNFNIENIGPTASGDNLIASNGRGEAETEFSGTTGTYDFVFGYYDESGGTSRFEVEIGNKRDKEKYGWSNVSVGKDNFVTYTLENVDIKSGADIKIKTRGNEKDFVYLDYVDIVSKTDEAAFSESHFYNGGLYLAAEQDDPWAEALSIGGEIVQTEKDSAEALWLENALGTTKEIIKIDVSESQFALLQDAERIDANQLLRIEAEALAWEGKSKIKKEDYASAHKAVEIKEYASTKAQFTGESGLYSISVSYLNREGKGTLSASLAGQSLGDWKLLESEDAFITSELTSAIFINTGDQLELSTGDDKFQLDYINFSVAEELEKEDSGLSADSVEILIEAESMLRTDKAKIKDGDFASGDKYIEIDDDKLGATATTLFDGETGYYDVVVGYYDGNKGEAELAFRVNEEASYSWVLDQDFGNKKASEETFVTRTVVSGIELTAEDTLQIWGRKNGEDRAFIDYIKLIKVDAPKEISNVFDADSTANSDILQGGEGNDILHGNSGDDLLYGNEGNDTLEGGIGSDTLDGSDVIAQGANEIDILSGGLGEDRFVLGRAEGAYYISSGNGDYALIEDFEIAVDVLQLNGGASDYRHEQDGSDLRLFRDQDLVAILEDTTSSDFDSANVAYV